MKSTSRMRQMPPKMSFSPAHGGSKNIMKTTLTHDRHLDSPLVDGRVPAEDKVHSNGDEGVCAAIKVLLMPDHAAIYQPPPASGQVPSIRIYSSQRLHLWAREKHSTKPGCGEGVFLNTGLRRRGETESKEQVYPGLVVAPGTHLEGAVVTVVGPVGEVHHAEVLQLDARHEMDSASVGDIGKAIPKLLERIAFRAAGNTSSQSRLVLRRPPPAQGTQPTLPLLNQYSTMPCSFNTNVYKGYGYN
ncbi:hypothetical protein E2C01_035616 [Portunus trituberculatus]|uniref:Uncharacterized protein n=1 Tax=Portunus trituberculatus TaxID=210409 RepID=A0A5B7FBY4_PORTR|nr:hypothetical protein [Portunus trituberculatus]